MEQQPKTVCDVGIPFSERNDWKAPTSSNDISETKILSCVTTLFENEKPLGKKTSLILGRSINE